MRLAFSAAAAALALAAPAAATPADDLHRLMDEEYRWLLRENPTDATALGVRDYDAAIRDLSQEARDRRARDAQPSPGARHSGASSHPPTGSIARS